MTSNKNATANIQSVSYTAIANCELDRLILSLVAQVFIGNNTNKVVITTAAGDTTSLIRTAHNAFTNTNTTQNGHGLIGCIRLLLMDQDDDEKDRALQDSWLLAVEDSVLTVIRRQQGKNNETDNNNNNNPVFQNAITDFVKQVQDHLLAAVSKQSKITNNAALVGDVWTVADIVVAIGLAHVLSLSKSTTTTREYVQNVLQRLVDCGVEKDALTKLLNNLQEQGGGGDGSAKEDTTMATATATDDGNNAILRLLREHQIPHEVYNHVLCRTAEELLTNVPLDNNDTETHTKNLFFRDKKHGLFLVTIATKHTVNTKELGGMLKLPGKTNLRLADEKLLDEKLHVKPGCVGPLCMGLAPKNDAEDPKENVTFVLDQALLNDYQIIHSHPLRNDMSVKLTPEALQDYMKKVGVTPTVLEFTAAAATTTTAASATPVGGKAPANRPPESKKASSAQQQQQKKQAAAATSNKKNVKKGETLLALQWKKNENFPMWYSDVITLSEMISYYDISGCYILRPWSYKIWELIQNWFNDKIEEIGVENAYFPMFVSKDRLEKEKDHVEGFAPEVAWVTKSGADDLANPIAVRPTSETIMYPAYSDWIQSHRDLPLKLNQWSNVVRWEFKYPTPFLRTREFLWQEGHTAHESFEEADQMVMDALDLYRRVYEELLAVPTVPGFKTEKEKFAGGFRTTTVEAYIAGSGRAIQGATSHNLGQNFGKMFDITFQNKEGKSQVAWQTSWGLTTRTIGVMVMVHGDDKGLVLPPRVAPLQVVIVPIYSKKFTEDMANPYCVSILDDLKKIGIRAKLDDRTIYNPGWKYNHWEQKGVPIRVEVGPRDIEQNSARIVIRHDGLKEDLPVEGLGAVLTKKLEEIQSAMFEKAKAARDSHVVQVTDWKDFVPNLEKNNLVLTPWCGGEHQDWEEWVKTKSREESLAALGQEEEDEQTATSVAAKTLCIPFEQPELPAGTKCIASGKDATCWVLWGRSY